jgi:hypothetical protein
MTYRHGVWALSSGRGSEQLRNPADAVNPVEVKESENGPNTLVIDYSRFPCLTGKECFASKEALLSPNRTMA